MQTYSRGTHIGPYEVLELLPGGDGGMAAIYLARPRPHYAGPPLVALKVAHPHGMCNDFLKYEVEHMLQLCDEHILAALPIPGLHAIQDQPIYIAKTEPSNPRSPWYLVTEYMRGGSLERLLARCGLLSCVEAVEIAWQIAVALSRLHARQIVHLDIKPSNILFREPLSHWWASVPRVVVSDLGIARPAGHATTVYGSTPYIAPERAAGAAPQPSNDIFSLGVLLYEMVTGRLPFSGVAVPGASISDHLRPAQVNPSVPPELERVILRALATDVGQRYPSIRHLRRDLEALPQIERPGRIKLPLFKPRAFAPLFNAGVPAAA